MPLVPHACLKCKRTFKREYAAFDYYKKCPHCGDRAYQLDERFRPPKKSEDEQWKKVGLLIRRGFYFQKIYDKKGDMWLRVKYPGTLREAKTFVEKYKDQALDINFATGESKAKYAPKKPLRKLMGELKQIHHEAQKKKTTRKKYAK
jgi:predicted  nucleic acid-binding Zn-ribbon protein